MKMEPIDVDVRNKRTFQHLVLLFDRPDFVIRCLLLRTKSLLSVPKKKTITEEYLIPNHRGISKEIFNEIKKLREDYRYPKELEEAIKAAILRNRVTDKDIRLYEPKSYPQKEPLRGYMHPILGLRFEETIKRDREWYLLNISGYGYRKIEKKSGQHLTTIETAIKSYKKKLSVKIF